MDVVVPIPVSSLYFLLECQLFQGQGQRVAASAFGRIHCCGMRQREHADALCVKTLSLSQHFEVKVADLDA